MKTVSSHADVDARLRANVRGFYAWLGSLVVLGGSPIAASALLDRGTPIARAGAVMLGVLGMVPWMWVVFQMIRRGDEFVRRMHLVACAAAFAGALVILAAVDWLVRAEFIEPIDYMLLWVSFLLVWLIALLVTKRYYERER